MFWLLLKKEMKVFFTNKGNLVFMILLPILLISIFSVALGDYIKADYQTFADGKVFYYDKEADEERLRDFQAITEEIIKATGVTFEAVEDYETARVSVEGSEAYAVIYLKEGGYEYFRSSFNEPEGGKIVRSLFEELANGGTEQLSSVQRVSLEARPLDSKIYYTFSALAFSIMFMGLLIGHSVYEEKELDTIIRIELSKAGVGGMLAGKIVTGVVCGLGQVLSAFLFSNLVLGVSWGEYTARIMIVLSFLILFSAVFGAGVGMKSKNKSMCQSTVLMFTMICGYLGGAITPLYLLENVPVLQWIVKISPLYWVNRSLISLSQGIADEKMIYSIGVLSGLAIAAFILFLLPTVLRRKQFTKKEAMTV